MSIIAVKSSIVASLITVNLPQINGHPFTAAQWQIPALTKPLFFVPNGLTGHVAEREGRKVVDVLTMQLLHAQIKQ
jgi:hypothetical protein